MMSAACDRGDVWMHVEGLGTLLGSKSQLEQQGVSLLESKETLELHAVLMRAPGAWAQRGAAACGGGGCGKVDVVSPTGATEMCCKMVFKEIELWEICLLVKQKKVGRTCQSDRPEVRPTVSFSHNSYVRLMDAKISK